jgi:hypothetical protein
MKTLLLVLVLLCSSFAITGVGVKGQLVANEIGLGFGAGFFGMIDVADIFMLYPGIDFWYAQEEHDRQYWDHDHWEYYDYWRRSAYEFAFDLDGAFKVPVKPIQPYMGFGLAPVWSVEDWERNYSHHSDAGMGFDIFGGILFPMGAYSGLFELRGKIGHEFNVFKIAFGMVFGTNRNSRR